MTDEKNNNSPLISVIIPVYKAEKYINRCINSVLSQSYQNFEIILVDDGSPDNCGEICDTYSKSDKRIRTVHIKNGGVSHARNVGLEYVIGKYVTFIDSDDFCKNNYLEVLVREAKKNDSDLVQSGFVYVDEHGVLYKERVRKVYNYTFVNKNNNLNYIIKNFFVENNGWEVWTTLFKTEIIKQNNIRFCETCDNFAEDLGFIIEYALYCKNASSIFPCEYCYVQHESSKMAISKNEIKTDSVNEVAKAFAKSFFRVFGERKYRKKYVLLYHLIMENQYSAMKLKGQNRKEALKADKLVSDIKWHDKWMKKIVLCRKDLIEIYGKKRAGEHILNSLLLSHRNWNRHKIEKFIILRLLIKG